jgi:hypothetical protein
MEYTIVPVNMTLKQKDERLLHIEEIVEAKKRMLLEKQKKFQFITKQNHFLSEVKNDYVTYYNYIVQQKQEQIMALEILNSYINEIKNQGYLSKHNMEDAKFEQEKILKEVDSIKKGLESIIKDTQYINTKL